MPDSSDYPVGNFNYPTDYRLGCGRISELADACQRQGMRRPLVVTDPGIAELPWLGEIERQLAGQLGGVAVFAEVEANPRSSNIDAGVDRYRRENCDGVVMVGGGSALDAGKCIALMAGHEGRCIDYEDVGDNWQKIDGTRIAAMIAVPTTAGTGSEVGRASVIADEHDHDRKAIIFHPKMLPPVVIADPELTAALPPGLTAATGIDAFVHAFEAFCAPGYHPMADGIALESMALIARYLPRAYANGDDLEARTHMLMASTMGATAFQKGLGIVHAIAHALGAEIRSHHGLTNAILLPYCIEFNADAIGTACAQICRRIERPGPSVASLRDWVLEFRAELAIPDTLMALEGFADADRERLVELALRDPTMTTTPKPADRAAVLALIEAAAIGRHSAGI